MGVGNKVCGFNQILVEAQLTLGRGQGRGDKKNDLFVPVACVYPAAAPDPSDFEPTSSDSRFHRPASVSRALSVNKISQYIAACCAHTNTHTHTQIVCFIA